jgi:tRNA uridine 5-carboxymethylaminomethyl modification enzyme
MAKRIEGVTPVGALRLLMHVRKNRGFAKELDGEDTAVAEVLASSP